MRADGKAVSVRGPRPAVERIADRLLGSGYLYRVEGSFYGHRYAEVCVRFEAEEAVVKGRALALSLRRTC